MSLKLLFKRLRNWALSALYLHNCESYESREHSGQSFLLVVWLVHWHWRPKWTGDYGNNLHLLYLQKWFYSCSELHVRFTTKLLASTYIMHACLEKCIQKYMFMSLTLKLTHIIEFCLLAQCLILWLPKTKLRFETFWPDHDTLFYN